MDDSVNNTSLNMNNPDTKCLKLTQISKFLSQDASSINKLNELSIHREASVSPKLIVPAKKQTKLKDKSSSKLNLKKLNSSGCLEESIAMQTQASKYFKKVDISVNGNTSTNKSMSEPDESTKNDAFHCPICQTDLTNIEDRQAHVNQCLDKGFSSKAVKKPRELKKTASVEKSVTKGTEGASSSKKAAPELNIEDAVPNCPICGKVFQTHNVEINFIV